DLDPTVDVRDRRLALGYPGLEQLLDTGQTGRDVVTGHTTDVEGTHRQLRTGLADGLCGHDAHRLTDVHQLAGGHRAAVAHPADPGGRRAGQRAPHLDRLDARLHQPGQCRVAEVVALADQHVAVGVADLLLRAARVDAGPQVTVGDPAAGTVVLGDRHGDAALGAAVDLTDDDVLRDVHQPPGQVTRVGGPQRGVRQTLAGSVRGDEVLQHGQALTEVGLDRARDVLTLGVRHQALHARQLADLGHVAGGTGLHDGGDRVVGGEVLLHRPGHLLGGLAPDLHHLVVALLVRQRTAAVPLVDLLGLELVGVEDLLLARRHDDIGDGDRDPRAGGPVETGVLEPVQGLGDLRHR